MTAGAEALSLGGEQPRPEVGRVALSDSVGVSETNNEGALFGMPGFQTLREGEPSEGHMFRLPGYADMQSLVARRADDSYLLEYR